MHAYILAGGTSEGRSDHIKELLNKRSISPHDVITISPEPTSIGIDSVRGLLHRLSLHPVASPYHAVIIGSAQTMTQEAQNAFLKTLEEPPGDALIILETNQPDALLPTILSRCQLVNLRQVRTHTADVLLQYINTIEELNEASVGRRLKTIDALTKTRDDALAFTNLAIVALEQELKKSGSHAKILRALLTARAQLLGNINPKLAIDAVFLYNGL